MKRFIAILLVVLMTAALFASCKKEDNGGINVCLASEPDTLDPALNSAVDGATLVSHLFSGLAKWSQDSNGKLIIVADAAKELVAPVANEDGTVTYTYTLRDGLKWSDGQDVKASDFVFAWNRAASFDLGADYGYMFDVVKGYDAMAESVDDPSGAKDEDGNPIQVAANPDAKLAVVADDAAKTITVTLNNAVAYWNELLAFPTYFPVREDVVKNESWATNPKTYICNGAYTIESWKHNSKIVLKKNANYVDADSVKMEYINFYLEDDANNMLSNFKKGSWQLIDDVPTNEIAALKKSYPDEFVVAGQIGTYYVCWNINEEILPADKITDDPVANEKARQEIRNAVSLFFDRNYIVDEIGQAGQVPASSFVAMGMTDADGSEFYKNANKDAGNSFVGYYDVAKEAMEANAAAACAVLDKYYTKGADGKYTNFPTMTYLYNTSDGHKAIGEYLAAAIAQYGITMNLENQEWNTFLNTRKEGQYSIARNGWLADYNDPICFLDMWTTFSGNNDVQYGKGANAALAMYNLDLSSVGYTDIVVENGTWAQTYDVLITKIKNETDNAKRMQMMHIAEDMLMETGCICPLYYYTDIYMIDKDVTGFFANPLGYKYFMYCEMN